MVNKCSVVYCKSQSKGFGFPSEEKYPELRKKWIEFVNKVDLQPSANSRICQDHFEEKYISFGKKNHLKWELQPIPTIHTDNDNTIAPSLLGVPNAPRKPPRKRNYQEDELYSIK